MANNTPTTTEEEQRQGLTPTSYKGVQTGTNASLDAMKASGQLPTALRVAALQAAQRRAEQQAEQDYINNFNLNNSLKDASQAVYEAQQAFLNPSSDTTYTDIAAAYEANARKSLESQLAALAQQLATSKNATTRNYDSAAAQNYINYMRQQRALPEQLLAQGIRGGASESALTRVGNNYAMNQGSNEASRNSAIAQLQGSHDTSAANLRQTIEDAIMANQLEMRGKQAQFDYQRSQDAYNRWQDALTRQSTLEQQKYERSQAAREQAMQNFENALQRYNATHTDLKRLRKYIKDYKANHKGDKYYTEYLALLRKREGEIEAALNGPNANK